MARLHVLLVLALIAGCARSDQTAEVAASADLAEEARGNAAAAFDAVPVVPAHQTAPAVALPDSTLGRRLIRTADVGLTVRDVAGARRDATHLVRRVGGFVGAEGENRHGERTEVRLTLRVPAARFDEVLDHLTADGDAVAYRNVRVEDVTDRVVDLEARLRARRAVHARYLQLLARADEIGAVLAVEAKVAEMQEAIESAEGQLRGLRDRIGLSTIELTLSDREPGVFASGPPFVRRVGDAFMAGLAGLTELLLAVVALWPLLLIGGVLVVWLRPWLRRRRLAAPPAAPVV